MTAFRDPHHWEIRIGRLLLSCWCPDAPCTRTGVAHRPHRPRLTVVRRG